MKRGKGGEGLHLTGSLDDIARQCFEVEAREKPTPGGRIVFLMFLLVVSAYLASLFPVGYAPAFIFGPFLVALAVFSGSRVVLVRRHVRRAMAAFHAGDPDAVRQVYRFAVREFSGQVMEHRARTLGSDSEWGMARGSLAEAADEAQRSVAYWEARVEQEPDNQLAASQAGAAGELEEKLQSALAKLDARASTLLRFYNECDAKLALMGRYNRDIEETRRLEELSGKTDMAIAGAEDTLLAIGEQFVREAQALGRALGGLAQVQIKSLAGEAPLDNIEYLADRIIESSDAERRAVEDLDRVLQQR